MSQIEHERSAPSPEPGGSSPCWSCKQPVASRALFCHACGAIQPPGSLDYFTRLGLPRSFDIDGDRLEKQYLGFQRVLHPDRFVAKSAKERAIAESQSAEMNDAYETLKDPLRRAAYLLKLAGRKAAVAHDQTVNDPILLMEAMEAREQLAEAASIQEVEKLQVEAGAQAIDLIAQLSRAFAAEDFDLADKLATRFKYLRKYLEETRARRVALEDAHVITLLQIHEPGETPAPHEEERGIAIGIDLGTTNSVAAIATDGKPEILRDEQGDGLVPSVVSYAGSVPVVGRQAVIEQLTKHPEKVVSSVKRLMGRGAADLKTLAGTLPYEIHGDQQVGMVRLKVAGRVLSPVEVSADILRAIKVRAEAALGKEVDRAVVTVPAYFDDAARAATKDAAKLAGLEVLRLVNEPTAAALAYGLDHGVEGLYAVYDLGGGTFDISLLRLQQGVFQVLSTGGDAALGGDDFDHGLAESILTAVNGKKPSLVETKNLLLAARSAKEALTERETTEFFASAGGTQIRRNVTRAEFEKLIEPMLAKTLKACRQVLEDAGVPASDVKGVVLVGGSTRVPLVRRMVAKFFGREPLADINPDEVVAAGAALQAEALTRGGDTLLLDVIPLSLGVETVGGIVEKVIDRNTVIPVAKAQEFTTYQDGQTGLLIHVVQGERETVDACRSLGRFELTGIPPMVAGAARIRITFAVDADGLLTVSAQEKTTGVKAEIAVKPSYGLGDDEMADMLRASLTHAREDMERRLLIEVRVEAERMLLALDAARKSDGDLIGAEERTTIDQAVAKLRTTMAGEDRDRIAAAVEEVEKASHPFAQRRMDRAMGTALKGQRLDEVEASMATDRAD